MYFFKILTAQRILLKLLQGHQLIDDVLIEYFDVYWTENRYDRH